MRPFVGIGVLCLLLLGQGQQCFGQRVYADAEQHSDDVVLLLTVAQVINPGRSVDNNYDNVSQLKITVGALGLFTAWQNLQFTGIDKPKNNSPLYFKMNPTGLSVLSLLKSFKVQRTNNKALVGSAYTGQSLIDLLGLFGSADSTYLVVPPPSNSSLAFDGIRLTNGDGILNVLGTANIYYSLFITTPKISGDTDSVCQNALPSTLTLTLANSGETGITYYLFKDTLGLNYKPGSPLNTSNSNYLGTFTNHQITIPNPFLTLGTGEQTQKYYIIAQDNANSPAFFYSAWKEITFKRTILEPPPPPTADIQ